MSEADKTILGGTRPGGRLSPSVAVRLGVYRERPLIDKTLHVFGDRSPPGAPPRPFRKIPLAWERAAGGEDNPAGTSVPNVIDPADPLRPAGFAPVPRHWAPRRRWLAPCSARGRRDRAARWRRTGANNS